MPTRPFSFSDYFFSSPEYGPGLPDLAIPDSIQSLFSKATTSIPMLVKLKQAMARSGAKSSTQYLDSLSRGPYTDMAGAYMDQNLDPTDPSNLAPMVPETPLDIALTGAGATEALAPLASSARGASVSRAARLAGRTALSTGAVAGGAETARALHEGDRHRAASSAVGTGLAIAGLVGGSRADAAARSDWLSKVGGEEDQFGNVWVRRGNSLVRVDDSGRPLVGNEPLKSGLPRDMPTLAEMAGREEGVAGRIGRFAPEPPPSDFSHPVLQKVKDVLSTLDEVTREKVVRGAITGRPGGTATLKNMANQIRQTLIDAGIQPNESGRLGDLPLVTSRGMAKGGSNARNLEGLVYENVQGGRIPTPEPLPPEVKPAPPSRAPMGPRLGPPAPTMAFDPTSGELVPTMPTAAQPRQPRARAKTAPQLPQSKVNLGPASSPTRIEGPTPMFLDLPGAAKADAAAQQGMAKKNFAAYMALDSALGRNRLKNSGQPVALANNFDEMGSLEKLNAVTRAIKASFDLSAPRQAAQLIPGNPLTSIRNVVNMVKAAASPSSYASQAEGRAQSQMYEKGQIGGLFDTQAAAGAPEEAFQAGKAVESTLAKGGPVGRLAAKGFAASERGFQNFLDNMRLDVFSKMVSNGEQSLTKQGKTIQTHPEEFQNLYSKAAEYSNKASGRGNVPAGMSGLMGKVFWSPRLVSARLGMMKDIPTWWARTDIPPAVKSQMYKDALVAVGTGLGALYAAQQAGAQVSADPASADFGKIKLGNTRFDIWGGFQQPVRALLRIYQYQREDTHRYGEETPVEIGTNYFRNKLSPVPGAALDAISPRFGQTRTQSLASDLAPVPLIGQDIWEAIQQNPGLTPEQKTELAMAAGLSSFFGTGVNSYQPSANHGKPKRRPGGHSGYRAPQF